MNRCLKCVMPDTRPDVPFTEGVCQACINAEKRPEIDWAQRKKELGDLIERGRNSSGFDCIIPSSGGKDSHMQALTIIGMGARPLLVTASTCHLTKIGRMNIDNMKRFATTIEVSPNKMVRAQLNRAGLEVVGDISHPEHMSIFTTPFRMAAALGIPLILYGECPNDAYGGPKGTEESRQMTQRWVSEYGGFLGLRPTDLVGYRGITLHDMRDYMMPSLEDLQKANVEAHFLGQYIGPWDSHENARIAKEHGMVQVLPGSANWWNFENLDCSLTSIHDFEMYLKYGYARAATQLSVDIRNGRITRKVAMDIVKQRDGLFPDVYMGVTLDEMLHAVDIPKAHMLNCFDAFTTWELFTDQVDRGRPVLKEFA